jgi:ParB family chromosome partitioning protein
MKDLHMTDRVLNFIDIEMLVPDPDVPQRSVDEEQDDELARSISEHGILLPLLVREDNGRVVVIAGQRRLRAAKVAGLNEIPCVLAVDDPLILSVVENVQRQNLSVVEEAEVLSELARIRGYSHVELGHLIGKKQSTVAELLSVARLPDEIRDSARGNGNIASSILVELAKVEDREEQLRCFDQYQRGSLSREELRSVSRKKRSLQEVSIAKLKEFNKRLDTLALEAMGPVDEFCQVLGEIEKKVHEKIEHARQLLVYRHADDQGGK